MREHGFVKLNRRILDWRWYKDANTFRVFIHLILNANFKDGEFQNLSIKRGQIVTGRKKLSDQLNMTERGVRTALNHLKSTNEIAIKSHSKFSIITILNYDKYQNLTDKTTNKRPANDQQTTSNRPQYKNDKKEKKNKKGINNHYIDPVERERFVEIFESKSLFKD